MIALLALALAPQFSVDGAPKLLVVDLDDVGYDLLRDSPTPTLDWIEANGRFFTDFMTAPICSPTRAMFNTGAYPSHPDLLLGQVVQPNGGWEMPLAPLEPLAQIVSQAGYSTAKIGKWHLGPRTAESHPNDAGWQHYAGSIANVQSIGLGFSFFPKTINGVTTNVAGRYLTTDETDDALALVRGGVDLVSVSYHAPHRPWHEPPAHLHTVSPINDDRDRARAMLEACDRELGRLVREALVLGYTILVFADNGTAQPIGGQKGTLYDGGVVVPFWAIGPGIAPGVDETRVGAVDLYATIADFFAVPVGGATRGPHSRSFLPELAGFAGERRWHYSERFQGLGQDPRTSTVAWRRTIRGERYKLLMSHEGNPEFFVDLVADPAELINLLGSPLATEAQSALDLFRLVATRL